MRYLIDTHVLIWYLNGNRALSEKQITLMRDPGNEIFLSVASIWEITIKMSSKKLELSKSINEIEQFIISKDFELLNVSFGHLETLYNLSKQHGDPFDHMIISQAISEDLVILSVDRLFQDYPVNVIW